FSTSSCAFSVCTCRATTESYTLSLHDAIPILPDGSGFAVCEAVRRRDAGIPILFLTASDEEVSIIRGLDAGGDDYLTKPFRLGEDRKSTRLNSSHVSISYAVFCLKKKRPKMTQ